MAKVEMEVFYPFGVDKVWTALTEADELNAWYMRPESFLAVVGQKFRLHSKPNPLWDGIAYCEILSVEKPRQLSWSQSDTLDGPVSFTLTWTLTPEGEGTRLHLLQDGPSGLKGQMIAVFMGKGWKRVLGVRLKEWLEMGITQRDSAPGL